MNPTCICLRLGNFHYQSLSDYLNSFNSAARPLPTLWFVSTDKDVLQIKNDIENLINESDSAFVFTKGHFAGANISDAEAALVQQIWLT